MTDDTKPEGQVDTYTAEDIEKFVTALAAMAKVAPGSLEGEMVERLATIAAVAESLKQQIYTPVHPGNREPNWVQWQAEYLARQAGLMAERHPSKAPWRGGMAWGPTEEAAFQEVLVCVGCGRAEGHPEGCGLGGYVPRGQF